MKKNDEGFTLIELLIVIVILGILATVVVFAVGGITDRGEDNACRAEQKTLEVALEAYYAQESVYPSTLSQLVDNDYLRSTPKLYDIDAAGNAVASDSQCTSL